MKLVNVQLFQRRHFYTYQSFFIKLPIYVTGIREIKYILHISSVILKSKIFLVGPKSRVKLTDDNPFD